MTSSSGSGRRGRISSVSHAAAISRRSSSIVSARSGTVRSGRSSRISASATCRCLWISVRRVISVGCAVSTSSIRSAHDRLVQRVGRDPAGDQPRERLLARGRLRTGAPGCAGSRGAAARGGAARRCWRASGSARTRAPPAAPTRPAGRAARRRARRHRRPRPARACFDSARTRSTVSNSACPSRSRSVSPSSPPSIRTSSRSGAWGSPPAVAMRPIIPLRRSTRYGHPEYHLRSLPLMAGRRIWRHDARLGQFRSPHVDDVHV